MMQKAMMIDLAQQISMAEAFSAGSAAPLARSSLTRCLRPFLPLETSPLLPPVISLEPGLKTALGPYLSMLLSAQLCESFLRPIAIEHHQANQFRKGLV